MHRFISSVKTGAIDFPLDSSAEFVNIKGGTSGLVGKALVYTRASQSSATTSGNKPYTGAGRYTDHLYVQNGKTNESEVCVRTTGGGHALGSVPPWSDLPSFRIAMI